MSEGATPAAHRFRRVEELFAAASERPAAERAAWFERECGGDDALLREVRGLFEAAGGAREFLETPPDPRVGRRVGRWRLVRRIGAGGMGVVYAAEHADGAFEQNVAVKLLRSALDTPDLVARFEHERRVLARLEHPGIARLLDGGATDDGLPYLVMELVAGEPLDAWCDARKLPLERRLELLREVVLAVHYAHQNLVVHRDLKPSNLLVTAEGRPKLLDFGIAKVLEPGPEERTLTLQRRLTPEYASPELVRGGIVTTASDVYALGVILYELACGARPYRTRTDTPAELERAICDVLPPPPSAADVDEGAARARAAAPQDLRARLRGDFDAIVLCALAKQPERRYPSAFALAEDLRRFLASEPVAARRPGALDALRLWVRRNRVAAAIGLVAVLVFAAGATASTLGWIAARRNAREASVNADAAKKNSDAATRQSQVTAKVNELLVEMIRSFEVGNSPLTEAEDVPTRMRSVRARLDRGALASDPLAEATLRAALAGIWTRLELHHEAMRDARAAAERFGSTLGPADRRTLVASTVLASTLSEVGDYPAAEPILREMLAVESDSAEVQAALSGALEVLGILLIREARFEEAESALRQLCEIRQRASGPKSTTLYSAVNALGLSLVEKGDFVAAEPLLRENLENRRAVIKSPARPIAISLRNWGFALAGLRRFEDAERAFEESRSMREALYGSAHPFYTNVVENLAEVHRETGRLESAEAMFRDVLRIRRQHYGPRHPELSFALVNLGDVLLRQDRPQEALPLLEEGAAMADSIRRDGHPRRERARDLLERARSALASASAAR